VYTSERHFLPNFEILLELVKREALIGIEGCRDGREDSGQVHGTRAAAGKSGSQNSARGQERCDFLARHLSLSLDSVYTLLRTGGRATSLL